MNREWVVFDCAARMFVGVGNGPGVKDVMEAGRFTAAGALLHANEFPDRALVMRGPEAHLSGFMRDPQLWNFQSFAHH